MSAVFLLEGVEPGPAERYRRGGIYELSSDERDEKADEEDALNDDYDNEGHNDEY